MKSWSAKALATPRVTQDNQGKKTAGVDGIKSLSPKKRLNLVEELQLGSKPNPTRRVWIDKPGKDEKRPLGIPTMYDRGLQALVKLALEPEWEAKFEPNSYGFRPGRSCHDAIAAEGAECGLNIVIRTAVLTPHGTSIGIGGGVVALSDPEAEFEEAFLKGKALVEAFTKTVLGSNRL